MAYCLCLLALISSPTSSNTLAPLPIIKELPDPFLFNDGHRLASPDDWRARRTEIIELVSKYEYGHRPPAPKNVALDAVLESGMRFDGASSFQSLRLKFGPKQALTTTVHLYIPKSAPRLLPVILRFGLGGEHAQAAIGRGYAFVSFDQTSLDPDTEGHDEVGPAQAAYPDYDWGSVAVWSWCASRVLDYLESVPEIDATKAVITGHSRTGKAALLTGALDERFALVVPNGSGCGGASTFRNAPKGVETLELITRASRFKSWFQADFGQFGNAVERLPFDQHFMRALVAPRPLLTTDAYGDQWCNPPGTQAAWQGAQPVYDFLDVRTKNMIHFRQGGHDQLPPDFENLLNVADHFLLGKPLDGDYQQAPFPTLSAPFSWKIP